MRVVVSTTLLATSARKQDDDDVAEVAIDIVIENTDLTSLVGWLPKLVLVTRNVQITDNAVLSRMDASFQMLEPVSGVLGHLRHRPSGRAWLGVPVPRRRGVGDRVREHLQQPCAAPNRLGVPRPGHDDRTRAVSTAMPRWSR